MGNVRDCLTRYDLDLTVVASIGLDRFGATLVESGILEDPPMSRALLVIDVQNEYFTGALPITHPAGHLEQILKVMDAAAGRIPTVVIQHHSEGLPIFRRGSRSEEHTSELQSRQYLVCRLLLEKKKPHSPHVHDLSS